MKLNPIIFGTSCLGNLYREIPMETKVAVAAEWFKAYPHPTIDSAGKYGAGLSLECIGRALKARLASDEEWKRGIGRPHASTYLNGEMWYDDWNSAPRPPEGAPEPKEAFGVWR